MKPFTMRRGRYPILDGIEFDNGKTVISTREAPMKTSIYSSFIEFKKDFIDSMNVSDVFITWYKTLEEDDVQELSGQTAQKKVVKGPKGKWAR